MKWRIGYGSQRYGSRQYGLQLGVIGIALAGWVVVPTASAELIAQGTHVQSQDETPHSSAGCVEVEVNGMRSPSYDCLTDKLKPAASAAGASPVKQMGSEEIAQRPGNQLGVFNWSATSQRMGNNFGKSATPQRPATPAPTSPLIRPGS